MYPTRMIVTCDDRTTDKVYRSKKHAQRQLRKMAKKRTIRCFVYFSDARSVHMQSVNCSGFATGSGDNLAVW